MEGELSHPDAENALGDFLRARRAALDTRRAGLQEDGRLRRVPGLRREELAQLANISVDYVVRLEQGRTRRVSRQVLDSLAEALQLTPDERAYLFTLAEMPPTTLKRVPAESQTQSKSRQLVTPQLQQLVDDMQDVPAIVVYRRMDVLAWNRGAAALMTDFGDMAPDERNLIRLMFLDDTFRRLYANWPQAARDCVAILRMEAGQHPGDPDLIALIGDLCIRDSDFRKWWSSHPVHGLGPISRTFQHPTAGRLTLDVHQLLIGTDPDLQLNAYTAPAGTASREALHFLLRSSASSTDQKEITPSRSTNRG